MTVKSEDLIVGPRWFLGTWTFLQDKNTR